MGKTYYENFTTDFHFFCSELSWQIFVGLQDMSWKRLQHVFSITVFCLPRRHLARRLEDLQDVFKTSWKIKILCWRCLEDITWRCLQKMSWRRLADMSWKRLQDTLETNKIFTGDVRYYIINLYLTNLYLTNLREIQNALIRTKSFQHSSYFESQATFLF